MKVLPNAFGIAVMFTLDPIRRVGYSIISEKHHDVTNPEVIAVYQNR
jgi:hypothetical protein